MLPMLNPLGCAPDGKENGHRGALGQEKGVSVGGGEMWTIKAFPKHHSKADWGRIAGKWGEGLHRSTMMVGGSGAGGVFPRSIQAGATPPPTLYQTAPETLRG